MRLRLHRALTHDKAAVGGASSITPVPSCRLVPRPPRLAFALALLAVLAQLWMLQISTTHLAQRVGLQAFWGDICTVHNSPYTAVDLSDPSAGGQSNKALPGGASCPVCSTAAASFAPFAAPAPLPTLPVQTLARRGSADHPAPALRHAGLRPPAQAPPVV